MEQLVKDSLFLAYKDGARPLTTEDLLTVSKRTYPLAITMREDISALRKFAHNRAQPADGEDIVTSAEDIPDEENPFENEVDKMRFDILIEIDENGKLDKRRV